VKAWLTKNWHYVALGVLVVMVGTAVWSAITTHLQHQKYVKAFEEMQGYHVEAMQSVQDYRKKVDEAQAEAAKEVARIVATMEADLVQVIQEQDAELKSQLQEIEKRYAVTLQLKLEELGHDTDALADDPDALYRKFLDTFGLSADPSP